MKSDPNMPMDEGTIKFGCHWIEGDPPSDDGLQALMEVRDRLHVLGAIGVYDNGIGFGNTSTRIGESLQFVISGTQTAHWPTLMPEHYTVVTEFNLEENRLTCWGPVKASSESLTHAAIYTYQPQVTGILHVHNRRVWEKLLFEVPTTGQEVPYGTPQMAQEMFRLFEEENLGERKILAMAGHEEGIVTFGKDLLEAEAVLMEYYSQAQGA